VFVGEDELLFELLLEEQGLCLKQFVAVVLSGELRSEVVLLKLQLRDLGV
jgi:hypothetical protein